jgi:hypothetical protein
MKDYIGYAKNLNASSKVISWIKHNLKNYLDKNPEVPVEIEHIIDFLVSDEAPVKMDQMSYLEAAKATEKWVKKLIKKGEHIKESPKDTEVILDFEDGFKIVKLIGQRAYEREGYLMRHCVGSYSGLDKEIYSLRDKNNMPHCTMEKDQQIKGKGNGSIHPKYVGYIVKFLEWTGMEVRDSEMANLGYVNIEEINDDNAVFPDLFKDKYFYSENKVLDKNGQPYQSVSLWSKFKIFDLDVDLNIKWNFDIKLSIETFIKNLEIKGKKTKSSHLTGNQSAASNTGYQSAASNTGDYSAASNTGDRSAASNTGDRSAASNTGDYSAASNTGDYSAASNTGDYSAASNTGYQSAASNTGYHSAASNTGNHSAASNTGNHSAASNTGNQSAASNTGSQSAALTTGYESKSDVQEKNSVAISTGRKGMAKGANGSWIVLTERDDVWNIICVKTAQIDGKKLKADTWYKLENKRFMEVLN